MSVPSSPIGLLPAFTPQLRRTNNVDTEGEQFKIFQDTDGSSSPLMKQKKASTANIGVLEDSNQYYPTPVATSAAGPMLESSSPIKHNSNAPENGRMLMQNEDDVHDDMRDNNIVEEEDQEKENLNLVDTIVQKHPTLAQTSARSDTRVPLTNVAIMKLSRSGSFTTVGRSSRSSDVALDSKNKHVSRVHAKAKFDHKKSCLTVDCLGWNGLVVCVPQKDKDQEVGYRINKGQSVTLPFKEGIYLDLRGERVLVSVDDEETEDERPICMSESQEKLLQERESPKNGKGQGKAVATTASPMTPCRELQKQHSLNKRASSVESLAEAKKRSKTVSPKQNSNGKKQQQRSPMVSNNNTSTTAGSNNNTTTTPPEESYDKENVTNIVSNYLAFSRLQSVPLSTIWKSNSVLTKLRESTLRSILQSTDCVGVIQRIGKDASGKPLEEEYYYVPEKDTNVDRRTIVEQSRGHIGLRSCRKSHKQYFWKKPTK